MKDRFEWAYSSFSYSFPLIESPDVFLNTIKDISCILYTIFDDNTGKFYFYKEDNNYHIKSFSNDQDILLTFEKKLPSLYSDFLNKMSHIHRDSQESINYMIEKLFIEKKIVFNRKRVKNEIISSSNIFNVIKMKFNDDFLYQHIYKIHPYIINNTNYSKINKKIKNILDILKECPNINNKKNVIENIKFLNGRSSESFYFEMKYGFSWLLYIITEGNTLWLEEIGDFINPTSPLLTECNPILIGLIKDDINILKYFLNNLNDIIQNPFLDIKRIIPSYENYIILDNKNISLLSLSILLGAFDVSLYLIKNGADVNLKSGALNESPIFFACRIISINFVELLVNNGADINIENKNNNIAAEIIPLCNDGNKIFEYLEKLRKEKAS